MATVGDRQLLTMWGDAHALPQWRRAGAWIEGAGRMSVAMRDGELLSLRERCFGASLTGLGTCRACGARVEVSLNIADLMGRSAAIDGGTFTHDGETITWRMPSAEDLHAIAGCVDVEEARLRLLERCVAGALSEDAIAKVCALAEKAGAAGDAEIRIVCPDCASEWTVLFDAPSFFWSELQAEASHLLDDVHLLAAAYGWSEDAILGMTRARRAAYVKRVAG